MYNIGPYVKTKPRLSLKITQTYKPHTPSKSLILLQTQLHTIINEHRAYSYHANKCIGLGIIGRQIFFRCAVIFEHLSDRIGASRRNFDKRTV